MSSYNVFAGTWESGAGAIFAENEALAWLVELFGWPKTAGGCFVSGGTVGNLSALVAARQLPGTGWGAVRWGSGSWRARRRRIPLFGRRRGAGCRSGDPAGNDQAG